MVSPVRAREFERLRGLTQEEKLSNQKEKGRGKGKGNWGEIRD